MYIVWQAGNPESLCDTLCPLWLIDFCLVYEEPTKGYPFAESCGHPLESNRPLRRSAQRLGDYEGSHSSRLQRNPCYVRVRQQLHNPLDPQGRHPRRNLLQLPSVFYRQAEADGYRRPRRAFPPQVRQERSTEGLSNSLAPLRGFWRASATEALLI